MFLSTNDQRYWTLAKLEGSANTTQELLNGQQLQDGDKGISSLLKKSVSFSSEIALEKELTRSFSDVEAASTSQDVKYQSRMKAEIERMKRANSGTDKTERAFIEYDFEQARIDCTIRGDDLSKNMISRTLLQAFHKIDENWGRFYREWDPESDGEVLEHLHLILGECKDVSSYTTSLITI